MRDPYDVLGVGRSADEATIKRAYRRLAKTYHPDANPGDAEAERRFKEASAAYAILSDPERRRRFDSGQIGADGNERGPFGFGARARRGGAGGGFGGIDLDDVLNDLFGRTDPGGPCNRARRAPPRGGDARYRAEVPFTVAVLGGRVPLSLPGGRVLEINVPPGTEDGQQLRLRGQGRPGAAGAGDALVLIRVAPHPLLRREGDDIALDLPVSLPEAVLGGKVEVPTVDGPVRVTVAPGSNSGTRLRLRGKGVPRADGGRGDQYVRLLVTLPEPRDAELEAFVRRWAAERGYDPRPKAEAV